jgi:hypothetical protein
MAQELKAIGFRCGKHKAGTLMKLTGVTAKQRKRFKVRIPVKVGHRFRFKLDH